MPNPNPPEIVRAKPHYRHPQRLVEIYNWIEAYRAEHDQRSPTNREICAGCNISSTSVARYYILKMTQYGMCRYDVGIARGLVPLPRIMWNGL